MTAEEVAGHPDLPGLLRSGRPIAPAALVGDWRGTSLGLPAWVDRVAWKVFRKSVRATPAGHRGWNTRVHQQAGPTVAIERRGAPVTFGPFEVDGPVDTPFGRGARLDYGAAHPAWHPLARVRDVLVELDDGLLLGATWLELGAARVRTPSWFTLTREA